MRCRPQWWLLRETRGHGGEADPEPGAAADRQRVEAESKQAAQGDAVEMDEGVGRRYPVQNVCDGRAATRSARQTSNVASIHGARRKRTSGRPEKVVLLFDGERPCGADGGRQREVKQILEEQNVGPPGRGS